jgi:PEGA domain
VVTDLPTAPVAAGRLRLRTEPAGVRVLVDGIELPGAFNEGVSMQSGRRRVRLEKPGYDPAEIVMDVPADGVADAGRLVLAPSMAGLDVTSEPAGLPVEIESESLVAADLEKVMRSAVTPAAWQRLPLGVYQVKVRDIDGTVRTAQAEVGADGVAKTRIKFPRARLEVRGFPDGSRVWLGKRLVGRTPLQWAVPPGEVDVTVEPPGKASQVNRVQFTADAVTIVAAGEAPETLALAPDER